MSVSTEEIQIVDGTEDDWLNLMKLGKEEFGWFAAKQEYNVWKNILGTNQLKVIKDSAGNLIAALNCNIYNKELASITWYYTRADKRGQGYGSHLFKEGFLRPAGARNKGLFAVPNMVAAYSDKLGCFNKIPDSKMVCYDVTEPKFENLNICDKDLTIVDATSIPLEKLMDYHNHYLGKKFLENWLLQFPFTFSKVALDENGQVQGYGTIVLEVDEERVCISPLYACNENVASLLMRELYKEYPGKPLHLITYSNQSGIAKKLEATDGGWCQPMFTKNIVPVSDQLYCFTDYGLPT